MVISVFCLISSYYFWSQAKAIKNDDELVSAQRSTAKVINYDYSENIDIEGKIVTNSKKVYVFAEEQYIIDDKIEVGAEIEKGALIAKNKNNINKNVYAEMNGKVIDISNSDGIVTVITKDLNELSVGFYVPQLYCNDYKKGDEVVVTVNGDTYLAVICKTGFEMEEKTIEQEDGSLKTEVCLYMEASMTDSTNLWINEIGSISLNHIIASNTKSVQKGAIKYEGDIPYVERVRKDKKEKIMVELGKSDKDMIEIISNQIMVGDEIEIN